MSQFLGSAAHDVGDLFGFTSMFRVIFLLSGKCGVKSLDGGNLHKSKLKGGTSA